jgi:hypothetical protein
MKQISERLGVKIVGGLKEVNTAWAGSSLLIDLFRKLEMDRIAITVITYLTSPFSIDICPSIRQLSNFV